MNIQTAVICDAATESLGKLNLLGAFDTLSVVNFPSAHPQCALALRVAFDRADEGEHFFDFGFIDEDGAPFLPPMQIPVPVAFGPDNNLITRNLIVNLQNLTFDKPGSYSFEVAVDRRHFASIPLCVRHLQTPGAVPGGSLYPGHPG